MFVYSNSNPNSMENQIKIHTKFSNPFEKLYFSHDLIASTFVTALNEFYDRITSSIEMILSHSLLENTICCAQPTALFISMLFSYIFTDSLSVGMLNMDYWFYGWKCFFNKLHSVFGWTFKQMNRSTFNNECTKFKSIDECFDNNHHHRHPVEFNNKCFAVNNFIFIIIWLLNEQCSCNWW